MLEEEAGGGDADDAWQIGVVEPSGAQSSIYSLNDSHIFYNPSYARNNSLYESFSVHSLLPDAFPYLLRAF